MNSPLIIITVLYILGVVIGKIIHIPVFLSFFLVVIGLGFTVGCIYLKKNTAKPLLFLFFLIGLLNFQIRSLPPARNDISNLPKDKYLTIVGQVDDEPRIIDDKAFFSLRASKVGEREVSGLVSVMTKASKLNYGDKVEVSGKLEEIESLSNPGIMSFADYLKNKGISCQLRSTRAPPKILATNGGNKFKKVSIRIRNRLMLIPKQTLPEPYSTLLASIIFGTRASRTPKEIKEVYKRAGVAHLLVASGMHLGILVGVCLFVVRSSKMPLWLGVLITSLVNFLYAMMTGFGPSILRAAIMAEIVLIGLLVEREKEIYTALALAALIILLFNPKYLFDIGFQLSFAATWAMVYISPVINEKIKPYMPRMVSTTLSVAVSPVLATIPITIFHFSQTSVVGILTNIILLPWVGLVVVLGFVATVLGSFLLPLGELLNGANLIMLWGLHQIVSFLGNLPFALMYLAPPKFPLVLGYYISLVGAIEILRRGKFPRINKFRIAILSLAIISILFWNTALSDASTGLTITVLDVGQGDSILVDCPSGKKILVDGGDIKMGDKIIVPFLRKRGINKLDMVILTHPHGDHVGGLPEVLEKIKVDSVLDPAFDYNSNCYRRFLDLVKKNKIKYHIARAGQVLDFGQGVKAKVLHPSGQFSEETNCNNVSVVLRLEYGRFAMMLTGDNEEEGEEKILELFPEAALASSILKVGHHGSRTSTSDHFLSAVNPQSVAISCGRKNKFRHPHKSTMQKFKSTGIKVYRTDEQGAIVIKSDGQTFAILPQK
ncbi:DNA internalization-related competence protein ComEC/Rec2 [Candidatus Margulisiibacteriota bacterium]